MASKLAVYDTGYEDERFQQIVSQTLHCIICTNVIKDPVMCHNEHLFCRACITRYLMYSQTCPTCVQPLTVETLRQASRTVTNLLAELKIRCEFFERGCGKFIDVGDLERHVADCGFAPAICSNEGCELEVNKQDLLHHETAVCELRRVQCHSCKDIRREIDMVELNLAAVNEKLDRNDGNVKAVAAQVKVMQGQLNMQEEINRQLKADNVEIKESLNEITKQLERITRQTSHESQAEQPKKEVAEGEGTDRGLKIIVAGGKRGKESLNSVEIYNVRTGAWAPGQNMTQKRVAASSVVSNNQLFAIGGCVKSMECLSLNAVQVDQAIPWKTIPAELPVPLAGHCSVVYNGRLIVIGGFDRDSGAYSNSITEFSIVPPYTSKLLATMPHYKCGHCIVIFGDKIFIVGGRKSAKGNSALKDVIMYDITKNECQELAPLPYPACDIAAVKWGDENLMIMGGFENVNKPLNKVLLYNVKTQKSHMLPEMKYKRAGCVAAVVRDTVIVMGGKDERGNHLKSVESFRLDSYGWEELSEMHEARGCATAVAF